MRNYKASQTRTLNLKVPVVGADEEILFKEEKISLTIYEPMVGAVFLIHLIQ